MSERLEEPTPINRNYRNPEIKNYNLSIMKGQSVMSNKGVIYILTNPSFKEYVKSDMQTMWTSDYNSLIAANAHRLRSEYMQLTK